MQGRNDSNFEKQRALEQLLWVRYYSGFWEHNEHSRKQQITNKYTVLQMVTTATENNTVGKGRLWYRGEERFTII